MNFSSLRYAKINKLSISFSLACVMMYAIKVKWAPALWTVGRTHFPLCALLSACTIVRRWCSGATGKMCVVWFICFKQTLLRLYVTAFLGLVEGHRIGRGVHISVRFADFNIRLAFHGNGLYQLRDFAPFLLNLSRGVKWKRYEKCKGTVLHMYFLQSLQNVRELRVCLCYRIIVTVSEFCKSNHSIRVLTYSPHAMPKLRFRYGAMTI